MNGFSLKKKILLSIVAVVTILGAVLGIFIFYYLNNVLVDEKVKQIGQLGDEQVNESAQIIIGEQLFVRMLGTNSKVREFFANKTEAKKAELLSIFLEYSQEDSNYLAIYLLDKKGVGLVSTDPRFVGQDYSFRDYFKKAIAGGSPVDIAIGKTSGQFGYYFAHPVTNKNGDTLGVMVVKTGAKKMDDAIAMSALSGESTSMLSDENGVIIYSNRPDRFLKTIGAPSAEEKQNITQSDRYQGANISSLQYDEVQKIIREHKQQLTLKIHDAVDNDDEILNVSRIHDHSFYLISEIGLKQVTASVRTTSIVFTLLLLAGLLLMSLVLYRALSSVIRPLGDLKVFSQKISAGDFSQRIAVKTKDEFADVARSFNVMASSLEDLYRNLDKKVDERTSKMNESEARLAKSLHEAERLNKFMVGREMEMVQLKKRIIELEEQSKS